MDAHTSAPGIHKSKLGAILGNILYFVGAFLLALIIQTYVARPFIVNGASMDPTFNNGEYLIVEELSYRFRTPARGDVVVFKAPPKADGSGEKFFIKRIIGLPGERVDIRQGNVTIFNSAHPEGLPLEDAPYVRHRDRSTLSANVPEGNYFVMGDNRAGSFDSRAWGPLPEENIRGRALVRLLPLGRVALFPGAVNTDR